MSSRETRQQKIKRCILTPIPYFGWRHYNKVSRFEDEMNGVSYRRREWKEFRHVMYNSLWIGLLAAYFMLSRITGEFNPVKAIKEADRRSKTLSTLEQKSESPNQPSPQQSPSDQ